MSNQISRCLEFIRQLVLYELKSLISFDVIHSFGVNAFGLKLDVIPGAVNTTPVIKPMCLGEFRGSM